ncbi:SIR2 family NAD-dependent protein deacylase [Frankia sp. AgKG'84/4]|uniref:SIR2 family NAD-dependent protein deacylase n=1 Tax=Frankia sp. AgKG'84/4 TaxID=573490 RepID=UPI00200CFF9E|nr:SIR2 family protein [Frankia sp. AgKG'84/4]MCL9793421.1 SIR2 family protein [Frankia sp. AgKG'84/4]
MNERDWGRLVDQLKNGDCTPLVGPGVVGGGSLAAPRRTEGCAAIEYPFRDRADQPQVLHYADLAGDRSGSLRQRVARSVQDSSPPDFDVPSEPHALLARLPLPVYLTTNPNSFMGDALSQVGKRPRRTICPWHGNVAAGRANSLAEPFPNPEEPVVYHLHGSAEEPASLVLTEDDHLDFVMNLAMDRGADDQQIIPTHILPALTTRPLLFLGYNLDDWTFRLLFRGLLRTFASVEPRRHASIHLTRPVGGSTEYERRRAEDYVRAYFGRWNVAVYWGTTQEFCAELVDHLGWS